MSDAIDDHGLHESVLPGIPLEPDMGESWRKNRLSCSGSGRIERNFDLAYLDSLKIYKKDE